MALHFIFPHFNSKQTTRRDSYRYSFVMNYGHLPQEKLQKQVNFEEIFLSMHQVFLFWFLFLRFCLSRRGEAPLCRWSYFLDCGLFFWSTSKIFSFLNFSLVPNRNFELPKQNVLTCCCEAPSPWALRQKVEDVYAGEAPWVHTLRAGEAWVLNPRQS